MDVLDAGNAGRFRGRARSDLDRMADTASSSRSERIVLFASARAP